MTGLPLLRNFEPGSVFAYQGGAVIHVEQFLHDTLQLALKLPDKTRVLNACTDRYRFCVGLSAALARHQITLLPPNQTADMLERLQSRYPDMDPA